MDSMSGRVLSGILPILAARFRPAAAFIVIEPLAYVTLLSECRTLFPPSCVVAPTIATGHDSL